MKRRILIVDDIAVNREMLKNILGGEYETAEASNGADALSIIAQGGLSAVLLDLMMPDMDGFDVLVKLRGDSMLSQLPIIVMTGQTDVKSEEKAFGLGASDYISKPYKPAIIKQRVRSSIRLWETAAAINALKRDALTGLYTRAAFLRWFPKWLPKRTTASM
ncbi:MAG: response regulator [Eubacteriales bacterium]|nr:response regulator [Eubacteriales bacterium]MDD3881051.1 response regulator [Eubacteriales bacterium]MDD4511880.1 response regulator [Eubacteriales bacterium]